MKRTMTILLALTFAPMVYAAKAPTTAKLGDLTPDFSLTGADGKTHKLSQ